MGSSLSPSDITPGGIPRRTEITPASNPAGSVFEPGQVLKLLVSDTMAHSGKSLELDCERETMSLLDPVGRLIGTVTWDSVISHIQASSPKSHPRQLRRSARELRKVNVRYTSLNGEIFDSVSSGVGVDGLFIECTNHLSVGTTLNLAFTLPDSTDERVEAKGVVAWICPKADQYSFAPGMGIRFSTLSPRAQERLTEIAGV